MTRIGLLVASLLLASAPRTSNGQAPLQFELRDVADPAGIRFTIANGAAAGLKHLYETMLGGAAWLDFDGDGHLDLYLVQGHGDSAGAGAPGKEANVLYRNLGDGRFADVTSTAGVGDRHYGFGAAVGDIDNDGDADLYVTNYGPNVLYRNNGDGTFSDATETAGVGHPGWSTAAAFVDIDADGLLDLYVANYLVYDPRVHKACTGNPKKVPGYCHPNKFDGAPDALYLNRGDGRFEDISQAAGIAVSGRIRSKGLGILPTDFDRDGRIDIFVANDSVPNFLWRNLGDRTFEDAALEAGVALDASGKAQACMGIDGGDIDGDGDLDVVLSNFSEETDTVYLDEGDGFFRDGTAISGLARATYEPLGFGLGLLDFDLDGDLDYFVTRGHILDNLAIVSPGTRLTYRQRDQLFLNDGKGSFIDVSASAGAWFERPHVGRGVAFADFDNDGDADLLTVSIDVPVALLENVQRRPARWVGLRVRGGGVVNLDGYGSRVELKLSDRDAPVPFEIRSAASYLAANDPRRSIGLGAGAQPEWARVHWPDGRRERFVELSSGRYNLLAYGEGVEEP